MSEEPSSPRWWLWLLVSLAVVAVAAALWRWGQPLYQFLADQEQVRAWVQQLGAWGPLAIFGLELAQSLLAPIPGQAIEAASGYLYGPWWGVVYAFLGLALGSIIIFLLARRFGRPLAIRLVGERSMARLDRLAQRGGAPLFFLIWLVPFAPDDLACVAAGLTPMPLRQFLLLMIVGRLPGILVSVWLGANVARVSPVWWWLLLAAIGLAGLVIWRKGDEIQDAVLALIERLSQRL
ncbi:MAG: TVP38/TMEM64 family protein [Anaerolineae bacterium]|nr:TVP38/TMEM64 family protein [Anaerolineae bacterium]